MKTIDYEPGMLHASIRKLLLARSWTLRFMVVNPNISTY